jgi:hypothetical protein
LSRTADRVCPFCGAEIWLAQCDIVATNVEQADEIFDTSAAGGQATPPSGREVLGYHGQFPIIWRPPVEEEVSSRTSWLTTFTKSAAGVLTALADLPAEDLPRRVCNGCLSPLPADMDTREAHILAIVGINFAGKSHYLAAALTEATRKQGLAVAGCTEFAPDDDTAPRLHSEYYTRVFRDGELLELTQVDSQVRHRPLTFRVTFENARPFLLMTHDVSGEVLSDHRRRASVTPFLRRASAVIFLVDPLEFDAVRAKVAPHELPPARHIHQTDLLSACLRELQYAPGGRDVPVAVTLSKSDILGRVLGEDYKFTRDASKEGWVQDVRETSDEVRNILVQLGESDLVQAAEAHSQVTFHAVSALGSAPDGRTVVNPAPRRCIDPLGTVLMRLTHALR